jgi:glycosyltransferase involved in cell wall biosynthesis
MGCPQEIMSSMDEILQVVTDTNRRGAQVFATDLHAAFERKGRAVRTVALTEGDPGGLDLPVLGRGRRTPDTLRNLRRELSRASVAVAHGSTTLDMCALASVVSTTRFIYRQISDSRFWAPSGLRRLRVRLAMKRAAAIVALWSGSAATLHEHLGVPTTKIRVIPNGVPANRFPLRRPDERSTTRRTLGLEPGAPVAVCVGALVAEKGVDLVIDAVAVIPDLQLVVVGQGPERSRLEAQARTAAPGRITFLGSQLDPRPAYAAADVVVLASRGGDSMPAVLIEAGLVGLPAVATAIDAIPEIVVDGVTGRVVTPGVVPELVEAIRWTFDEPHRMEALAAVARARCLKLFEIDAIADRWLDLVDVVAPPRG